MQLGQLRTEYNRIAKFNTEIVHVTPENLDRTREFIEKSKLSREDIPFPVVIDPERQIVKTYLIEKPAEKMTEVHPSLFVIDQKGILRFKYVGMDPYDRPPIEHLEEILGLVTGKR